MSPSCMPIEPGLSRKEFMARLENAIEGEMVRLRPARITRNVARQNGGQIMDGESFYHQQQYNVWHASHWLFNQPDDRILSRWLLCDWP